MLTGGARLSCRPGAYRRRIAQMYTQAIERLAKAGLAQYEISNFCAWVCSRHNLRYWQRALSRPGPDASSMLRASQDESALAESGYVLRSTTTDDLAAFLVGSQPAETGWLSPASQMRKPGSSFATQRGSRWPRSSENSAVQRLRRHSGW